MSLLFCRTLPYGTRQNPQARKWIWQTTRGHLYTVISLSWPCLLHWSARCVFVWLSLQESLCRTVERNPKLNLNAAKNQCQHKRKQIHWCSGGKASGTGPDSHIQLFMYDTGGMLVSERLILPTVSHTGGKKTKGGNSHRLRDGFSGTGDNFMQ